MVTQTLMLKPKPVYILQVNNFTGRLQKLIYRFSARPCMIVSVGLLLAGLSIPFLMGFQVIPSSILLGLAGMALTSIGCVRVLYYM